jgi:hypothetical protein
MTLSAAEVQELLPYLTTEERAELDELLAADFEAVRWRALPGPQSMAWASRADITGYGGSAGGGKTDLIAGLVQDGSCHERALVVRREKAQTEGVIQRLAEIMGGTDGFNSQKSAWRIPGGALTEFAGLDNPGDERRWQGRPHDLKAFDEVTEMREHQVRFIMGWTRTNNPGLHARVLMTFNPPTTREGRWVIDFFGPWLDKKHPLYPTPPGELRYAAMLPDGRGGSRDVWLDRPDAFVLVEDAPCYEFDPAKFTPEQIVTPKSRTFIPARLTDNPYYMASGYMSTLQSLPEPLRSQMLYGDFQAGVTDDQWQVIPTAWVEAAQARWTDRRPKGEMMTMGVDVARGGKDQTILAPKHVGMWFDQLQCFAGKDTPDGPAVVGHVISSVRDSAPILIDVIGVGASPYDLLKGANQDVHGVNVSEKALGTDRSGRLTFLNQRSELIWKFRELLDPQYDTGICLPPDNALLADLCAFTWKLQGMTIKVDSRDEVIARIGRSPDRASAVFLAAIDMPKIARLNRNAGREAVINYDPLDHLPGHDSPSLDYDPLGRV